MDFLVNGILFYDNKVWVPLVLESLELRKISWKVLKCSFYDFCQKFQEISWNFVAQFSFHFSLQSQPWKLSLALGCCQTKIRTNIAFFIWL